MDDMNEILRVESLVCGYGREPVVQGVSFTVPSGAFTGIIGPNGCGKTTLIRALVRLLKPSGGRVLYRDQETGAIPYRTFAREVAYVPPAMEVFFPYSVYELVSMARFPFTGRFGRLSAGDREIVAEALSLFELDTLQPRYVWELSDGERQRVFLAQAVAQTPALLILDEPTSHLDIGHQFTIMDILKHLNEAKGTTILCVLHDLNLAAEYCDRLLLMSRGSLAATGTPDQVLTYGMVEDVYQTRVLVYPNPHTGRPYVVGIPRTWLPVVK